MEAATADANTAAGKATNAADRAETLYKTEAELEETLTHVRNLYAQMEELKTGIAYIVDGGTPSSVDVLVCDGGTPFTREEIEINCGTP